MNIGKGRGLHVYPQPQDQIIDDRGIDYVTLGQGQRFLKEYLGYVVMALNSNRLCNVLGNRRGLTRGKQDNKVCQSIFYLELSDFVVV